MLPPRASSNGDCFVRLTSDSLHDLTGPVNQIRTIAELLFKNYGDKLDQDAETLFGFVQEAAGRLQSLTSGLRTYLRVLGTPAPCSSCDADSLLEGAAASLRPEIEVTGTILTSDSLPSIFCRPDQIQYTFASLIENAIKFRREVPPRVHVSASIESNVVVFSVRDNGVGIDPRYTQRIFGLFKRIESAAGKTGGPGVGLAIARQIVEQHDGRIWVESTVGEGSTFFFNLPQPA